MLASVYKGEMEVGALLAVMQWRVDTLKKEMRNVRRAVRMMGSFESEGGFAVSRLEEEEMMVWVEGVQRVLR